MAGRQCHVSERCQSPGTRGLLSSALRRSPSGTIRAPDPPVDDLPRPGLHALSNAVLAEDPGKWTRRRTDLRTAGSVLALLLVHRLPLLPVPRLPPAPLPNQHDQQDMRNRFRDIQCAYSQHCDSGS